MFHPINLIVSHFLVDVASVVCLRFRLIEEKSQYTALQANKLVAHKWRTVIVKEQFSYAIIPVHVTPFPEYPCMQAQPKEP